jgi:hypothetical protein
VNLPHLIVRVIVVAAVAALRIPFDRALVAIR